MSLPRSLEEWERIMEKNRVLEETVKKQGETIRKRDKNDIFRTIRRIEKEQPQQVKEGIEWLTEFLMTLDYNVGATTAFSAEYHSNDRRRKSEEYLQQREFKSSVGSKVSQGGVAMNSFRR